MAVLALISLKIQRAIIPKKIKKCFYKEYTVYNRNGGNDVYEDRGYKHLLENHHSCGKAKGKKCPICDSFISSKNCSIVYKKDDMYEVENEEMSCDNVSVNYSELVEFFNERTNIDVLQKQESFTTLIPPPLSKKDLKRGIKVYVTEMNANFCCDRTTPLTIQDPVWLNFSADAQQMRLDTPLLLFAQDGDHDFEKLQYRWK